ncbi:toxin HicA [Corticimicrobacter populi]|uniref:Toxin HicA n=1 Tax=Corticimicrobacter populi TaxID=2175229 RepID=A0A2V1K931_9BURK|nr:toxin HicA [Corticimicrobacter populi]PWF25482.1 toxin HicA [Corticimicrobacter populi]
MTADIGKIIRLMRTQPTNVRYADAVALCTVLFGAPRRTAGSHVIFKTPWPGDPRINLQWQGNKAKSYQIRQILEAIDRLDAVREMTK